jgi:hypothetical protein
MTAVLAIVLATTIGALVAETKPRRFEFTALRIVAAMSHECSVNGAAGSGATQYRRQTSLTTTCLG